MKPLKMVLLALFIQVRYMSVSLFAMKTFDHFCLIHVFLRVIRVVERPCGVITRVWNIIEVENKCMMSRSQWIVDIII
jgi:hypothetical protein